MLQDLRYAGRAFRATPTFTAIALLTIALGVGANTAMFSIVRGVLLKPLPYPAPERIVRVRRGSSWLDMRDWAAQSTTAERVAAYRVQLFDYDTGDLPERLDGALVTSGLFELLGASPLAGRLLSDADDAGDGHVAVITESFWRTKLASDSRAVGRTLMLNEVPREIVGVARGGFRLPWDPADVFVPYRPEAAQESASRGAHTLSAMLRLKAGVTLAAAQADMNGIAARLSAAYPRTNRDMRYTLVPLADSVVGSVRRALWVLAGTVGVVLLIACINVANLLIARGFARRQDIAVRIALGANRRHILRQIAAESLLLAVIGGVLGLAVAYGIAGAVVRLAGDALPRGADVTVDRGVLLFTAALSLASGLLFGVLPSWLAGRAAATGVIRSGRSDRSSSRVRSLLVVFEVALALVLVAASGMLVRSFRALLSQPLGFSTDHLLTGNVKFAAPRFRDIATRTRYFEALEQEIVSSGGAKSAGIVTELPIGGTPLMHNLTFDGRTVPPGSEPEVFYRGISGGYFRTIGLKVLRGRAFDPTDTATSMPVAIANESFARTYYASGDPIGQRVRWTSGDGEWITIVGLVPDIRGVALDESEVPALYVPLAQERNWWRMWADVVVRTTGDAAAFAPELRRAAGRVDRTVPIARVRTLDDVLQASLGPRRFNLGLIGAFALLAIFLAAAGTYGVMAYLVQQRSRELGVRLAIGATPASVVLLVARRGFALGCMGVAAGLGLWLAAARAIDAMLFGVAAFDAPTLGISALLLVAVAVAASAGPAFRAGRLDPLVILRAE